MIDMGVPGYLVASSVMAVLAQRLVRVVCSKCKQPFTPSDAVLESAGITPDMLASARFMKGKGCGHCSKSGYRGRIGIFELMMMTNKIRELAFAGAPTQEIRKVALSQGMTALYNDGIRKALSGITTLEEVFRVAKKASD
jgi:type IV pilus assembly protein PilB